MDVILVDKSDKEIGREEKHLAHKKGLLHRAFSVFIFNSKGDILLQKRNIEKYHSGGLWTNTCCSHPRPGKVLVEEAKERLNEEMGIVSDLEEIFSFTYKVKFSSGIYENEFDHVFFGKSDSIPKPDPSEASEWKWISLKKLNENMQKRPGEYTEWLKICIDDVIKHSQNFL
jgi:isopentenyl-diphosphate delta-isomerase